MAGCICICHGNKEFGKFVWWWAAFPLHLPCCCVVSVSLSSFYQNPLSITLFGHTLFHVYYLVLKAHCAAAPGCFKGFGLKPESRQTFSSSHFGFFCCFPGKNLFCTNGIVVVSGISPWMWICVKVNWETSPRQIALFLIAKAEIKLVNFLLPLWCYKWLYAFLPQIRVLYVCILCNQDVATSLEFRFLVC